MILHGEQETEILKHPIPLSGTFELRRKVIGVYDKGSGAAIVGENLLVCPRTGEPLVRNVGTSFIRGIGGFGGDRGPSVNINPPNRSPDAVQVEKTSEYQAQIYRLSGDYNPLHIDPSIASIVGFERPILHGLCTYGIACRAVLKNFCNNDTRLMRHIKARFTNPVLPGQTLTTKMWKQGNRVHFVTEIEGVSRPAISNSYIDLNTTDANPNPPTPSMSSLKSQPVFDEMAKRIKENPNVIRQVNAVYQFNLKTENGQIVNYTVDLKNASGSVRPGTATNPDCTMTISDSDYFDMATGKMNGQTAFMQGKLKISGNMALAQKLSSITSQNSKVYL